MLPIFAHGLGNYDSHLIVKNLPKHFTKGKEINVIAKNSERFMNIRIGGKSFVDT
jgi:hypothetical protein